MDITRHVTRYSPIDVARLPIGELDGLAADCQPVTAYAHYALFIDTSYGIGARAHCGTASQIHLGGMPDDTHPARLGLRDYVWVKLGMQPRYRIGSLGMAQPAAVWYSPQSLPVVDAIDYPMRRLQIAPRHFTVHGTAAGGDAIVIANRADRYGPFHVVSATIDGKPIAPAWADQATTIFRAPPALRGTQSLAWAIEIEAEPAFIDVVTLADATDALPATTHPHAAGN
jgi:hypothetical protein